MIYNLQVVNNSPFSTITVTGHRGDNFPVIASNQTISPGQSLNVASFDAGAPFQDCWGWIFLDIDGVACQIYAESTGSAGQFAFFGYFNSSSSESNSNPSPFPDGTATALTPFQTNTFNFLYTLLAQPAPVSDEHPVSTLEPKAHAVGAM